jgi:hypothetical protein
MKSLLAIVGLLLLAQPARADETSFFCSSEDAAVTVAKMMDVEHGRIVNQEEVDTVAHDYLEKGVCVFLPSEVRVTVLRTVGLFGSGTKVRVVEFESEAIIVDMGMKLFGFIAPEPQGPSI